MFIIVYQGKNVNIVVLGIGANVYKAKKDMQEIAGEKGKVLLFQNFGQLSDRFDQLLKAACGKLALPKLALLMEEVQWVDIC